MKNITKGFLTTTLGLGLIGFSVLDFTGFISVEAPEGVTELQQVIYAGVAGIVLFFVPATKIEEKVINLFNKKTDNL